MTHKIMILTSLPVLLMFPVRTIEIKPKLIRMEAIVSGYSSTVEETDDTPTITASGYTTNFGIMACPRKYPFGTRFQISGEVFECQDRMNYRYESEPIEHFDIFFEDAARARLYGRSREIIYMMVI